MSYLHRIAHIAAGFAIATALFLSLTALAQSLPTAVQPTVIDIRQDVPVLAEFDGTSIPFTLGVALKVNLSGPVTASVVAAPAPFITIVSGTEMIDNLNIPFTLSIDGGGLIITEWTAYANQHGKFSVAGEAEVDMDASDDVMAVIRYYGVSGDLIDVGDLYLTPYPKRQRFETATTLDPEQIGSYAVEIRVIPPQ